MSTVSSLAYAQYQSANPENTFNDKLIFWRGEDDAVGYLEDVFKALEVVPGITFNGIEVEKDESKIPADLLHNDIELNRMELARVKFRLEMQDIVEDITLCIFLPKLVDNFFYHLNGSIYYPILQLVDRGTYVTRKTFTLKTLLMPLIFRRDVFTTTTDMISGEEYTDMVYMLDLFRNRINILRYFFANRGLNETMKYFGMDEHIIIAEKADVENLNPAEYRVHEIRGSTGLCIVADKDWLAADEIETEERSAVSFYRTTMIATLVDALDGMQRKYILEDEVTQWRRRLGRFFTQNSNGFEEKAEKILVSLERILDRRTRKNLAHVHDSDKVDVYSILRWMMRDYRTLIQADGMDVRNKRIRVAEYLIHPLLLKFSESTYRLLNSKNLTFRGLRAMFRPFIYEEGSASRPQANFLVNKLVSNVLLRYSNMVNSFDLIPALRWTTRGPQSMAERGRADVSLRYRGHHPSYVGRVSLVAASAGDPGTSGTLVPYCPTQGQFFL